MMPPMRLLPTLFFAASLFCACSSATGAPPPSPAELAASVVIDHKVTTIDGKEVALSAYRGSALLIVNVASRCGFTPQYEGLEALYRKWKDRGFVILGFPSNDFAGQEPGSNEEIAAYCKRTWDLSFPLFAKVSVKGAGAAPLYQTLTTKTLRAFQGDVEWNFNKFLVDKDGHVVGRFGSRTEPSDAELDAAIQRILPR